MDDPALQLSEILKLLVKKYARQGAGLRSRQRPIRHPELAAQVEFADEGGAGTATSEKLLVTAEDTLGFGGIFEEQFNAEGGGTKF